VDDDCDGAVNEGCPCARITLYNVAVGGQYPTSDPSGDKIGPYDANSSPCTIAASPLHDAAAQIKIEPYPNVCKPGDHVILYDYDNCGGVVFSTGFSCTSTSRFNLNYWNAADKAGAWKIKCSTQ
jgi:hypothetical protein